MQVIGAASGSRDTKRSRYAFTGATPAFSQAGNVAPLPTQAFTPAFAEIPASAGHMGYAGIGLSSAFDPSVLYHPAYSRPLSFYEIPPTEELTVEDFERAALARLRVLQTLDAARAKGLKGDEYRKRVDAELRRAGLAGLRTASDIRRDVVSHFGLRFAFCRAADRRWFVQQEVALFRHRLRKDVGVVDSVADFLRLNGLDTQYRPVPQDELRAILPQLNVIEAAAAAERGARFSERTAENYYRVPFEEALDLIKHRRVLLRDGFAYIPEKEFGNILVSLFRTHLNRALAVAYRAVQTKLLATGAFETIAPILHNLSVSYSDAEATYSAENSTRRAGAVKLNDIDMLARRSMPLCMHNLHKALRKDHHLKHAGRMQYGLFLKGIGLDLKDALAFWRQEFTKAMDADKFDKSYAYNIRHNYGKEGKRTDYTPYSCIKIILMPVGSTTGEAHGCPFRHHDREHLRETLRSQISDGNAVQSILDLVANSHYQIACRKHWELTHPDAGHEQTRELVINHPNQYFDESEKYYEDKAGGAVKPETGSTASVPPQNFLQQAQDQARQRQEMQSAMQQVTGEGPTYRPRNAQELASNNIPAPKHIE